jgi:hypothetical protein
MQCSNRDAIDGLIGAATASGRVMPSGFSSLEIDDQFNFS